jgi:hypothetical protein
MRRLCSPAAALVLLALATEAAPRNWKQAPAIVQIDTQADIFAMGDVHGDYQRLVVLLAGAGLIGGIPTAPDRVAWSGGHAVLLFTGDMIDKGPDAVGVLALLRALQPAASAAGGRVVVLMGNHEAEFLAAPEGKDRDFPGQLLKAGLKPRDVAGCNGDLGRFLCSLPFGARVNDWFFSHAGNTGGRTLDRLEADLEADVSGHGFGAPQLADGNSILEARIGEKGPNGRAWFEAGGSRLPAGRLLASYAEALGVHHIVEGHHHAATRFPDGAERRVGEMFSWRGELFLIDTGMSRDIDESAGTILHIRPAKQNAAAVCADGREIVIWDAAYPQKTAAAPPCKPDTEPRP